MLFRPFPTVFHVTWQRPDNSSLTEKACVTGLLEKLCGVRSLQVITMGGDIIEGAPWFQ